MVLATYGLQDPKTNEAQSLTITIDSFELVFTLLRNYTRYGLRHYSVQNYEPLLIA
jgi:hypothetical protein